MNDITAVLSAEREAHLRRLSELEMRHTQENAVLREELTMLQKELQVCPVPPFQIYS